MNPDFQGNETARHAPCSIQRIAPYPVPLTGNNWMPPTDANFQTTSEPPGRPPSHRNNEPLVEPDVFHRAPHADISARIAYHPAISDRIVEAGVGVAVNPDAVDQRDKVVKVRGESSAREIQSPAPFHRLHGWQMVRDDHRFAPPSGGGLPQPARQPATVPEVPFAYCPGPKLAMPVVANGSVPLVVEASDGGRFTDYATFVS